VREFVMCDSGLDLVDVYLEGGELLTGSARQARQANAKRAAEMLRLDQAQRQRRLQSKRHAIEAQIAALRAELDAATTETDAALARESVQWQNDLQRLPGSTTKPRKGVR
jgi:circadian clock protein KaiC